MTARPPLNRRRFLTIASAACLAGPAAATAHVWTGIALGARARIVLDHPQAAVLTRKAVAEMERLEGIFSLYRPDSQISRLNRDGHLPAPAFELLDCLTIARQVWHDTEGRFDPTVQPLWQAMGKAKEAGIAADRQSLDRARAAVGFDRVRIDSDRVDLDQGQALTLNGIAQGYIADRVADVLRRAGVADVLIDTGEILPLGSAPGQQGWPVTIKGEASPRQVSGRAFATSAPAQLMLDAGQGIGHILDPRRTAASPGPIRQVTVSAPRAAVADALSTALCLAAGRDEAFGMLRGRKDARVESLYLGQ